jgi:hypothetical protein
VETASATTVSTAAHVAVASHAKPDAVRPDDTLVIGPVASFSTYQACTLYGALEFPVGSYFEGGTIIDTECLEGVPIPPATGSWDLFVEIETDVCSDSTPAAKAAPGANKVPTVKISAAKPLRC